MFSENKDILVLLGPTASGKSHAALKLAQKHQARIISADAFQVYEGLDIGTAKTNSQDRKNIIHYLIDIRKPTEAYSISTFKQDCLAKIEECRKDNCPIIICGGSALYIHAFLYNYSLEDAKRDETIQKQILETYPEKENRWLKLDQLNQDVASKIHQNNERRVLRALEKELYPKKYLEEKRSQRESLRKDCILVGIDIERDILYKRINDRVDLMFEKGWVEEVKNLLSTGVNVDMQAMQAIGYKEVCQYLENKSSFDVMVEKIKQNTRRFSKRQLTWFKKFDEIQWLKYELILKG